MASTASMPDVNQLDADTYNFSRNGVTADLVGSTTFGVANTCIRIIEDNHHHAISPALRDSVVRLVAGIIWCIPEWSSDWFNEDLERLANDVSKH